MLLGFYLKNIFIEKKMKKNNNIKTSAGFVALIGATNSGKSTLINTLVGKKVSIVTQKVQTTRNRIRAIVQEKNCQIILVDTPGIFFPKKKIERAMVKSAWNESDVSDETILVVDSSKKEIDINLLKIIKNFKNKKKNVSLILNKIDLIEKKLIVDRIKNFSILYDFKKIFLISAKYGYGIDDLKKWLGSQLPKGPFLFEKDTIFDFPDHKLAAEIMREKIFLNIHQELPYQITVLVDSWDVIDKKLIKCNITIYVSKISYKGMIIGKNGMTLKRIATATRKELEENLNKKIYIKTFVKYKKDLMEKQSTFEEIGLDFNA